MSEGIRGVAVTRGRVRAIRLLDALGLMHTARRAKATLSSLMPGSRRLARTHSARFEEFERHHPLAFTPAHANGGSSRGTALLMCGVFPRCVEVELFLIRALMVAGYDVEVLRLGGTSRFATPYYRLAGVSQFHDWDHFPPVVDLDWAEDLMREMGSYERMIECEIDGIRVGRSAASTALRRMQRGSLDLDRDGDRQALIGYLARSLQAAEGARQLVDEVEPEVAVFVDTEYTPTAEIFDTCLERGISALQYDIAHNSGALMLFRYNRGNRNQHPWTLSDHTWREMRQTPWSDAMSGRLSSELSGSYESGMWFADLGTQFNTESLDRDATRRALGLDSNKKTAVVFSHILWDAPIVLGHSLFANYEEWLVETVRAACANTSLNWLVKVHPVNLVRAWLEGLSEEPLEVIALRDRIGPLPPHVKLIPADTPLSTYSLLGVTDYCLTVRGTVGLEAARLGIPIVNGGGGRYDGRGFTMDPGSAEEYLDLLSRLETVSRLTEAERELADRFAYGYFLRRPLSLSSVTFGFSRASTSEHPNAIEASGRINVQTGDAWATASDVRAFVRWWNEDKHPDFFNASVD